jgi:hypothetical protein
MFMFTSTSGAIDRSRRAGSKSALGYGYPSTSADAPQGVACRGCWRCSRLASAASVGALESEEVFRYAALQMCSTRSIDESVCGRPLERVVALRVLRMMACVWPACSRREVEAANDLRRTNSTLGGSQKLCPCLSTYRRQGIQVEDLLMQS